MKLIITKIQRLDETNDDFFECLVETNFQPITVESKNHGHQIVGVFTSLIDDILCLRNPDYDFSDAYQVQYNIVNDEGLDLGCFECMITSTEEDKSIRTVVIPQSPKE